MADFLKVNGIPLSVLDASADLAVDEVGERTRAFNGAMRASFLAEKRKLTGTLTILTAEEVEFWRALLRGAGDVHHFETSYTAKGRAATTTNGAAATDQFRYGTYSWKFTNASTLVYTFPWLVGAPVWSVGAWVRGDAGRDFPSAWHYLVVRSDGSSYYAASPYSSAVAVSTTAGTGYANRLAVNTTTGTVTLYGDSSGANNRWWDDLLVLPALIPQTQGLYIAQAGAAFSDLPALSVSGEALGTGVTRSMIGEVGASKYRQGMVSGSLVLNLQDLPFTLSEV